MGSDCSTFRGSAPVEDEHVTQNAAAQPPPPAKPEENLDANEAVAKQKVVRKRIAIAAEALTNAADLKIPNIPKSDTAQALIEAGIAGNLLFDMLLIPARQAIIGSMTHLSVKSGTEIIKQGDTDATEFYVLEKGSCDVYVQNEGWTSPRKVHTYQPGSGFGELALLYSAPRAATVRAVQGCQLWVMERAVYNAVKHTYTQQVAQEKRTLLDHVPILAVLSEVQKQLLADALEPREFEAGRVVFKTGDLGDRFYIIQQGTVTVSRTGEGVIAQLSEGSYFGERSLIKDETPVDADVTADGYVVCYSLNRKAFNDLLGPIEDIWRYEALRKVPILFNLSEPQLFQMAQRMHSQSFEPDEMVFRKGDQGDKFYVISDGTFTIYDDNNRELARISKGSCFGELSLLRQDVRAANVKAVTAATVLALHRTDFNQILGNLQDIRNMWRFEALRKVPLLTALTPPQRSKLCTVLKSRRFREGDVIMRQGEPGETFYIVEAGQCSVEGAAGQQLKQLGPTDYFGELAILRNERRAATVRAVSDVNVLTLQRADFDAVLGPLQNLLEAQASGYTAGEPVPKVTKIAVTDLEKVAVLGTGAFGQVVLVRYQGKQYALKILSKLHIVSMGLQEHVKREKEVMVGCECAFLVQLVAGFQDEQALYMLLETVMGGEFFTYLQTLADPLREPHARFYAACVVLGLDYMQQRNMVWRDLKPENLLIATNGYLKLADFGFAKKLPLGQKTFTLCGTPEYLAPELVTQSGHTGAVDWWALGVLIFEMVAGYPPFYSENKVDMFKAICDVKYSFPDTFSKDCRDLVKRLLMYNPARRLGVTKGGAADVKSHPWFRDFDWDALAEGTMKAPYVPQVSHPEDTRNFDMSLADAIPWASNGKQRYKSTGIFTDF